MGHIRQSIHNLLGRVLPSGGTPRVPSGYTLANARGDAKTNLHETTVLDALKPTDRARALLAMAPLVADAVARGGKVLCGGTRQGAACARRIGTLFLGDRTWPV